ncbi:hypothetical protein ACWEIJ_09720 [Lentzea sp. NPDC004789]
MRKRQPPFRRRKLAKKLRKMRLDARMSIQEAAKALDKDVQRSTASRLRRPASTSTWCGR